MRRLGEMMVCLQAWSSARSIRRTGSCGTFCAWVRPVAVPRHAATRRRRYSVRLVEKLASPHLKGLVNAVLRRIAREGADPAGQPRPRAGSIRPTWLWDRWVATYGAEGARAIAAAHLIEAPLDLTPKADAELWTERLEAELLPTGTIRRTLGGSIVELPGFAEGAGGFRTPRRAARQAAGRCRRQARRRSLSRPRWQDHAALRRRRCGDGRRHLGAAYDRLAKTSSVPAFTPRPWPRMLPSGSRRAV